MLYFDAVASIFLFSALEICKIVVPLQRKSVMKTLSPTYHVVVTQKQGQQLICSQFAPYYA